MPRSISKMALVYLDDGSEGSTGRMGGHVESLLHDGVVRESKLLWTLGNYARFVRPGMVRVKCDVEPKQSPVDGCWHRPTKGRTGRLSSSLSTSLRRRPFAIWDPTGRPRFTRLPKHQVFAGASNRPRKSPFRLGPWRPSASTFRSRPTSRTKAGKRRQIA